MKYFEVTFSIQASEAIMQDCRDVLAALTADCGFETFEETPDGIIGYVQQVLFDEQQLQQVISAFPFDDVSVTYICKEAEDKDWNEQWEQEGFEPIVVNDTLVIHDGRHFNDLKTDQYSISIEIDAHLAFGTGTHETTQMMTASLLDLNLTGKNVLDCGCGTGILGIAAMKLGAQSCTAYDIDEWSVDNTRHNAVINQIEIQTMHGDATVLDTLTDQTFDVVLANINRNILLQDMPRFKQHLKDNGILLLSGFYTEDISLLQEKANALGLRIVGQKENNQWACLQLMSQALSPIRTPVL